MLATMISVSAVYNFFRPKVLDQTVRDVLLVIWALLDHEAIKYAKYRPTDVDLALSEALTRASERVTDL